MLVGKDLRSVGSNYRVTNTEQIRQYVQTQRLGLMGLTEDQYISYTIDEVQLPLPMDVKHRLIQTGTYALVWLIKDEELTEDLDLQIKELTKIGLVTLHTVQGDGSKVTLGDLIRS